MTLPARALALSLVTLAPAVCSAEPRQLQLSMRAGFATSSGTLAAPSSTVEVSGLYGLSDAFSLYTDLGYTLGFPDYGLRHGAHAALGAVYAFDMIRVVPYAGVGVRFDVVSGDENVVLAPSAEVRGGAYYLLRRGLALDLQASYAIPFVGGDLSSDHVSVTFGVRLLNEP